MSSIAIAAAVAALFSAPATLPAATVTITAPRIVNVVTVDLVERARQARSAGDLVAAERDFLAAIRQQRAEGLLTVDATYGAADLFVEQHRYRDALALLEQLANDANLLGDADTEARALLDVVSVRVTARQRYAARAEVQRLRTLTTDERVSHETRRLIKARIS